MDDPVLDALRRAVHATPTDLDLAAHLADRLAASGAREEAIQVAAAVLSVDPAHSGATAVMIAVIRVPSPVRELRLIEPDDGPARGRQPKKSARRETPSASWSSPSA